MVRVNRSYLDDLIDLIDNCNIRQNYITVIEMLYNTEFKSSVYEDLNRIIDAKNLRMELYGPVIRPISVLEVMIALAKRCHEDIMYGYTIDNKPSSIAYWFWVMMENCGLDQLSEWKSAYPERIKNEFDSIIGPILDRSYDYNGNGGFFPLHHPEMDQRYCELWYQMNAYLVENYPF